MLHETNTSLLQNNILSPVVNQNREEDQLLNPYTSMFPSWTDDLNHNEYEITLNFEDDDLLDHEIFDGSGDYSSYAEPITFAVPYSTMSTAYISVVSHTDRGADQLLTIKADESRYETSSRQTTVGPRACRIDELSHEERKLLKGDPGPPGECECDYQKISKYVGGKKGEPGETKYIVKLIGKDLPPIRSEVFKEALKQVIAMGLKGEKGDPGTLKDSRSNFITLSTYNNFDNYKRKIIEESDDDTTIAELILIDNDDNQVGKRPESKLFLRYGNTLHNIEMQPKKINLDRITQVPWIDENQPSNGSHNQYLRDSGRIERDNLSPSQNKHYNQSKFAQLRALSLLQSTKENKALGFSQNLVKYAISIALSISIVFHFCAT